MTDRYVHPKFVRSAGDVGRAITRLKRLEYTPLPAGMRRVGRPDQRASYDIDEHEANIRYIVLVLLGAASRLLTGFDTELDPPPG